MRTSSKKYRIIVLSVSAVLLLWAVFSCKEIKEQMPWNIPRVVYVQPFFGVRQDETAFVVAQIKKVYPFVQVLPAVALPDHAYLPARKRYRADAILEFLEIQTAGNDVTIGLTHKDISTTKNGSNDWGILGLGYRPGNACVASTYRLSKKNRKAQFFKVVVHELGHTEGLPHCPEKSCFMRDAKGGNPLNAEEKFCFSCKQVLLKKGWVL